MTMASSAAGADAFGDVGDEEYEFVAVPAIWFRWVTFILSLGGLGVSSYLTFTHYAGTHFLACSGSGVIDCAKVTTSSESVILGIPVAVLGLGFYFVFAIVNSPPMWALSVRWVHQARVALAIMGIGFVLYLVIAELFIIGSICLWCSSVHIVTLILFIMIVTSAPAVLSRDDLAA